MLEEPTVYSRGRRRGGVLQGQHLQRGGTHYNYDAYCHELMSVCGVVMVVVCIARSL